MIEHEYFGEIDDNYHEIFGGQTTTIENTTINGKQVACQLYVTKESLQTSILDALAQQHEQLNKLDKRARNLLFGVCSKLNEYEEELDLRSEDGETFTEQQFIENLKLNEVWLLTAAEDEIYKYESGMSESNIEDKDIHIYLIYYIEISSFLLLVHFNLQGKFIKVTYGPGY